MRRASARIATLETFEGSLTTSLYREPVQEQSSPSRQTRLPKGWVAIVLFIFAGAFGLGSLDDTILIRPVHPQNHVILIGLMVIFGCISAGIASVATGGRGSDERKQALLVFALTGAVGSLLIGQPLLLLAEQAREFPRQKTLTRIAVVPITSAFITHSKGQSWHVGLPFAGPLGVLSQDYWQMPRIASGDKVDITGFCARLTIQQSRQALRILHYGYGSLPAGTITRCPAQGVEATL